MISNNIQDIARSEALRSIEEDIAKYPSADWLKDAYVTNQGTITALRQGNKELRETVLAQTCIEREKIVPNI